jgi:hypothetical protein
MLAAQSWEALIACSILNRMLDVATTGLSWLAMMIGRRYEKAVAIDLLCVSIRLVHRHWHG